MIKNMVMVKEKDSLQAKGARTSDWLGQVKDGVLYAYDLSTLVSKSKGITEFTKKDFEIALKKASHTVKK